MVTFRTLNPDSDQYAWFGFHIVCPTCPLTGSAALGVNNIINQGSVKAYPNPANNELTVAFSTKANSVDVSLTNMVGQVVAAQTVTNGTAVFNTTSIAPGVYIMTLVANGERTTGRVVIAH